MRDVTLPVNSMLKFDVGIIGEPAPTVAWTMAGYPIKYESISSSYETLKDLNVSLFA